MIGLFAGRFLLFVKHSHGNDLADCVFAEERGVEVATSDGESGPGYTALGRKRKHFIHVQYNRRIVTQTDESLDVVGRVPTEESRVGSEKVDEVLVQEINTIFVA